MIKVFWRLSAFPLGIIIALVLVSYVPAYWVFTGKYYLKQHQLKNGWMFQWIKKIQG